MQTYFECIIYDIIYIRNVITYEAVLLYFRKSVKKYFYTKSNINYLRLFIFNTYK
jgi:hypothetical protein